MSARTLAILVAAIVVLGTAAYLGQRGGGAPSSDVIGTKLVPDLEQQLDDVNRIVVTRAGGAAVATLTRGADGWTVAEENGYRADVAKLRTAVIALGEARILEQKTSTPDLYARLGVQDVTAATATGTAVTLAGGRDWPTVILGDTEGEYRYARRAGEAPSYLIDRSPLFPPTAVEWLDRLVVALPGTRVSEITITHPGAPALVLRKPSADATDFTVENVPEGRELLYAGVANAVGNALRDLRFEDVEPAAAFTPDAAAVVTVEYRTFDGLALTIAGVERGEETWITIAARAADAAANANANANADAAAADAPASAAAPATGTPAEEAAQINARTAEWRYRIQRYQYDQLTRRMSDLLKPPEDAD